jgi:cytochrome c peroxidase
MLLLVAIGVCSAYVADQHEAQQYSFKGAPATREQLGEVLFFERELSLDGTKSCASCHIPAYGFADTVAFSRGVGGKTGNRNTPSCANVTDRPYLFYDGRAGSLEEQVRFPIENPVEMNMPIGRAVERLRGDKRYVAWFGKIFGDVPTEAGLKAAIAAYERTLETSKTPFDRYMVQEDSTLLSAAAQHGREVFMGKGKCLECHFTPDFTGDEFRNIGLFDGRQLNDSGRYLVTHNLADLGKFKVPGLRNVGVTAPYMHNGMFKTLKEVIDYYDDPRKTVPGAVNADSLISGPLHLSGTEKADIEAFLNTLTDDRFVKGK